MSFKYKLLLTLTPLIVILDQFTKWLILENLPLHTHIPVIPDFFDIVHVRNTGAAFGFLAESSASFREPFFYVVALIAVVVIAGIFRKLPSHAVYMSWVIALVTGGLVGNLIDRLRFGNVVDFLSFHWRDVWEWPSFNVADSAITIAMVLLIVHMLFLEKRNNR